MIPRQVEPVLNDNLRTFPAVALLGARQTGKTTLAKSLSADYFDLEIPSERLRLDLNWQTVAASKQISVFDEAQHFPELFPKLRSAIDSDRKRNGRFLILGSVSPGLMKQVSEFLTGRIALLELRPFSIEEIETVSVDNLWLMGGFPDGGILQKRQFPKWQTNYLDLLAMRDLPSWGLSAKPMVTQRFFRMTAAAHATLWNASQIGKSMGLSYHTVNTYLDYLEQAFLIRRLSPFSVNIRKRLIKRPKMYWRDSGLLHVLLKTHRFDDLIARPWVGASWEGWVIEQILTAVGNRDGPHDAYFFRTSDGYELDLVIVIDGEIWAFEIKLSSMVGRSDVDRLRKTAAMIGATKSFFVSRSEERIEGDAVTVANLPDMLRILFD